MKKLSVAIAVRPYPGPVRARVFALLGSAGVAVEAPPALGDGASNEDVISAGRAQGLTPAPGRG